MNNKALREQIRTELKWTQDSIERLSVQIELIQNKDDRERAISTLEQMQGKEHGLKIDLEGI